MAKDYRVNREIRAREVRVIGEDGEQVGILPLAEALRLAQEKSLDLVEVAPNATPPVCRLLDYGKFRYVQTKKEREVHKTQKSNLLREVRFRTRIGLHDRLAKVRQVKKLLEEGSRVKVSVMFRGREITHPELGVKLLRTVAEDVKEFARLERTPMMEGRILNIILAPSIQKDSAQKEAKTDEAQTEEPHAEEGELKGAKA